MKSNAELQREPVNPVVLIKDGKKYDPSMALKLQTPFVLKTSNYEIEVKPGDIPVYFKRKVLRVRGSSVSLHSIKYAVGVCREGKRLYHFLDSNGKTIEEVEEWQQ